VHALVARVMQGIGAPALILPPGASPHGYAMRPSEAAALAQADVVVWIGAPLTPWLGRAVDALAGDAVSLELLEAPGTSLLGYRDGATPGRQDGTSDEHGAGQNDGHDHGHADGGIDPHAWLDPENAKLWLDAIAAALSAADPENAPVYARNAAEGQAELDAVISEISRMLAPLRGRAFIVSHDAFQYLEHRFGLEASGAIAPGDATRPSPARIAAIRATLRAMGARCVFAEPQFAADLIATVIEGSDARAITLDPLGAALTPGPQLYPQLLRGLAAEMRRCLDQAA
jgi:zinc transport system substrate-binding protein